MDICYHNSFGLTDRVHQDHLAWKELREQKVLRYSSEIRYCGSLASTVKGKIQILTVVISAIYASKQKRFHMLLIRDFLAIFL